MHKFNPSLLSKYETEENRKQLKEFLKKDGNRVCSDCGAPRPTWASSNLGTFICQKCAGHHRSMGSVSKVRSISLDSWTKEQVQYLSCLDNVKSATYWEKYLPADFKRPRLDSLLREFVRNKYQFNKYIDKSVPAPTINNIKDHPWFESIQREEEEEEQVQEKPKLTSDLVPSSKVQEQDNYKIQIGAKKPQASRVGSAQGIRAPKMQETEDLLTVETPHPPKPEYDKNDPLGQIDPDQGYQLYQQLAVPQIGYDPNWRDAQGNQVSNPDATQEDEEGASVPPPGAVPQITYLPQPPKKEDPFEKSNIYSNPQQQPQAQQTSLNPSQYLSGKFRQPAGAPTPFNTPVVSQNSQLSSNNPSLYSNVSTLQSNYQVPNSKQQEVLMIEPKKKDKDVEMFEASVRNLADSSYLINSGLVGVQQKPVNQNVSMSMKEMAQQKQIQQQMLQQQLMQQSIEETQKMYNNIDLNDIKSFQQQAQPNPVPGASPQLGPDQQGQPKVQPIPPPQNGTFFQGANQGEKAPFKYFQNGSAAQPQVQNGLQKNDKPQIYNPMANDGLNSVNPVNQPKVSMRNGMSAT